MMQTVALSKAPIIASHSAVRALCRSQPQPGRRAAAGAEEERRRDADRGVQRLREDRASPTHPSAPRRSRRCARSSACPSRAAGAAAVAAVPARRRCAAGGGGGARPRLHRRASAPTYRRQRLAEIDKQASRRSAARPSRDFVNHIDYAVKLIGIDHVGISSDFDGGGGVDGWNDAERDVQRDARTGAPRLHRGADRQALERQPAARDARRGEGRASAQSGGFK